MNKRQAKIDALEIASIAIDELMGSDCTENAKVKKELEAISFALSNRSYRLNHKILPNEPKTVSNNEQKGKNCSMKGIGCPYISNKYMTCSICQFMV